MVVTNSPTTAGEKDVGFSVHELMHHFFEVVFVHLAMADDDTSLRDKFLNPGLHVLDGRHAVVEEEHLTAAGQFTSNGIADEPFVVGADRGLHRESVGRRRVNRGHVARAHQREVQSARNWRGREGENVDESEAFLEDFFVANADVPPANAETVAIDTVDGAARTFEPRGVTPLDTGVFVIGCIPFVWATWEFWRRIAVGASFGTGKDAIVFSTEEDPDEDQMRRFGGRRVLGKGALAVAYVLFAAAGGSVLLAVYAALNV